MRAYTILTLTDGTEYVGGEAEFDESEHEGMQQTLEEILDLDIIGLICADGRFVAVRTEQIRSIVLVPS